MARIALPFLPFWRLRSRGWMSSVASRSAIGLRKFALYQQYYRRVSFPGYDVNVGHAALAHPIDSSAEPHGPCRQFLRSRSSRKPNATCESTALSRRVWPDPRAYFVHMPAALQSVASEHAVVQRLAATCSREIDRPNPNQRMPAAQRKMPHAQLLDGPVRQCPLLSGSCRKGHLSS